MPTAVIWSMGARTLPASAKTSADERPSANSGETAPARLLTLVVNVSMVASGPAWPLLPLLLPPPAFFARLEDWTP